MSLRLAWKLGGLGSLLIISACTVSALPQQKVRPLVVVYVYDGVELLDFAGPTEAFSIARDSEGNACYRVVLVSKDAKPLTSQGVVKVTPQFSLKNCPQPDILVIPGGNVNPSAQDPIVRDKVSKWVKGSGHVLSICNGATLLASVGALEGRTIATHRSNFEIVRAVDPTITVHPSAKTVSKGKLTTAAGISSGIDGALFVIAQQQGLSVAQRASTDMEYLYWPGRKAKFITDIVQAEGDFLVQEGGIRLPEREWGIYRILTSIADRDSDEASAALYRSLYSQATGHDKEMLEPQSLEEISEWLYGIGRDRAVALKLSRLNAQVHPTRVEALVCFAKLLSRLGHHDEAVLNAKRAAQISPRHRGAQALLRYLATHLNRKS